MKISTRENLGITIVELDGRLESTTAGYGRTEMNRIVQEIGGDLVVDLSKTEYISSAGLRVLLTASKLLQSKNGRMKLSNANPQVAEVLNISGFHSLLHIHPDETDAIKSFLSDP